MASLFEIDITKVFHWLGDKAARRKIVRLSKKVAGLKEDLRLCKKSRKELRRHVGGVAEAID